MLLSKPMAIETSNAFIKKNVGSALSVASGCRRTDSNWDHLVSEESHHCEARCQTDRGLCGVERRFEDAAPVEKQVGERDTESADDEHLIERKHEQHRRVNGQAGAHHPFPSRRFDPESFRGGGNPALAHLADAVGPSRSS